MGIVGGGVLEGRVQTLVNLNKMQFRFVPGGKRWM